MRIKNDAGETVAEGLSDAEAVRWWNVEGRPGDWLEDTGELLSTVADSLQLDD